MRQKLIFKINSKEYEKDKYLFQNDKELVNINDVDIKKIVLSNKTPYGRHGTSKYYSAYLSKVFKPFCINIKNIKFYTNRMDVLTNNNELLKYIEIWNKIKTLSDGVALNKEGFHSHPIHNNKYIRTKISPYNEILRDFQKLVKHKY